MTQTELTLQYLKQAGNTGLHSFDLGKLVNSLRVAARINDLKNLGYSITSISERKGRSWGVRYFLLTGSSEVNNKPVYTFDPKKQMYVYG